MSCECCDNNQTESYNCTPDGCVDPGDGSGQYCCLSDCEPICDLCDTYDTWPASDPNGGPNQNSWCEWCVDYANNGFTNFNATGATWGPDPDVSCDCCTPTPTPSWCITINPQAAYYECSDPGDGSGQYSSLADCEAVANSSIIITLDQLCQCNTYSSWPTSDPNGGPNQNSWCEWCIDYQNPNSFYYPNFNPNGVNWGDPDVMCDCCPPPPATWSCKLNTTTNGYECTDPGDGSGTYTSLVDCQDWCDFGCDTYNAWPVSDPNGGPNQNSWCEWCLDYANNGFTNFNSTGSQWGDPDVMCSCCSSSNIIEKPNTKSIIQWIDLMGRDNANKSFKFEIYDDGTVDKKYIIE